jgi:dihydroorotate dehydrogenase electron transfer subunit
MILPRPLSICEVDSNERGIFRIVYQTIGAGTHEIAAFKVGDKVRVLGPLGSFYPIDHAHKNFALVGGGMGVPPLLELAKTIRREVPGAFINVYLGFRSLSQVILKDDFAKFADEVFTCTDDGSAGFKGNVISCLSEHNLADAIYGCGPKLMLKSLAGFAADNRAACFVSLEERMACMVGACLACVTKVHADTGDVVYKKVCSDGPVFNASEVVWDES